MCDRPSADAVMIAEYVSTGWTRVKQMTCLLALKVPVFQGIGVASLLMALEGPARLIPLMSPGCSSLTGSCILRLDFAASGAPPPPWPGKTGQSAIEIPKCVNAAVPLLACESRQGGAGTSGGARSGGKTQGPAGPLCLEDTSAVAWPGAALTGAVRTSAIIPTRLRQLL